ncbi:MAG: tRNA (guanine-N(7)-)-methyltransferase (tRNA(m7G46)-methyltransferase) [Ramalina farinacea]|uniref:tRNA (guanine(46)-N(7))-methyltransferase n=1 Tax=Ramalina farinacea TaxID=258253 RepID=A0AA43TWN7_9LECA|nr:tRNA (guanine-N(7)-)-methyltransferase (tRNA(m7G46)-methyltransferase) [Ramalina farinacea]
MEIRTQVTSYVNDRILALRRQNQPPKLPTTSQSPSPQQDSAAPSPTPYQNISALRTNSMKFLPNFFPRASLAHLFLCFPDPHFKARKHKARIVSETLCAEYAYVLRPGGCVWCITDVEELAGWMRARFREFGKAGGTAREGEGPEKVGDGVGDGGEGLFARVEIPEEGREGEWEDRTVGMLVKCMRQETEEGKKVTRNGGKKFVDVWRRREDLPWPGES